MLVCLLVLVLQAFKVRQHSRLPSTLKAVLAHCHSCSQWSSINMTALSPSNYCLLQVPFEQRPYLGSLDRPCVGAWQRASGMSACPSAPLADCRCRKSDLPPLTKKFFVRADLYLKLNFFSFTSRLLGFWGFGVLGFWGVLGV